MLASPRTPSATVCSATDTAFCLRHKILHVRVLKLLEQNGLILIRIAQARSRRRHAVETGPCFRGWQLAAARIRWGHAS